MVFGLFSKERALQKTIERATNKLAQQADRWAALDKLREDGSDEALYGLCKRWGVTSLKGVEDEEEKNWVVERLVEKGPVALTAIRRYMKNADQLSFPLKVLERVADHDKILEAIDEIFASEAPGYVRMPERRIDVMKWLSEWKGATDDEVISRVTPYLPDFDENVRFSAIDALATREPKKIAVLLVDALLRPEEESGRIRRTVLEVLEKTKAPLGDRASQVGAMMSGPLAEYRIDGGVVRHK